MSATPIPLPFPDLRILERWAIVCLRGDDSIGRRTTFIGGRMKKPNDKMNVASQLPPESELYELWCSLIKRTEEPAPVNCNYTHVLGPDDEITMSFPNTKENRSWFGSRFIMTLLFIDDNGTEFLRLLGVKRRSEWI
jgi:hypothetical protein